MNKKRLVFEIGVEEIPAQYVRTMAESLKANAADLFANLRLHYEDLNVHYTPRRFALIVDGLDEAQESVTRVNKGPSVNIAFQADGQTPTPALLGFLKKCGKTPADVKIEKDGKNSYVTVEMTLEGKKTEELVAEPLASLIFSIYCPNPMRWGEYKIKFIRPIRWLMAFFGDTLLPVSIECASSAPETYGHRTLADGPKPVKNADDYERALKDSFVILTEEERKAIIRRQIAALEAANGFEAEIDEALLDKVANIVEYPTCAVGHFEEKYLALPECVIKNPLKTQQCYFPVYRNGKIDNAFIYVRNGGDYMIDNVTRGNERVLRPRLADAQFFFDNDTKHTLKDLAQQLDNVVFVEKVGSYTDKAKRVAVIAKKFAGLVDYHDDEKIDLTVSLLKADLVSSVVREYTDIQGVVGGVFARRDGYPEDVCTAISEQYLPNFFGDSLPSTRFSAIVSIADKLDSIISLCAAGLKPTGSADPYGLRRQALSIFQIALDQGFDVDLDAFIRDVAGMYAPFYQAAGETTDENVEFLHNFFLQRLRVFLHEVKGIAISDIDRISVDDLNIYKSMKKAQMIQEIGETDWYKQFIQIFNRMQKLIKNMHVDAKFDPCLPDAEAADMFRVFTGKREEIVRMVDEEEYSGAIRQIAACAESITAFMENCRALCDDEALRCNRIAFFDDFCAVCGRIIQLD